MFIKFKKNINEAEPAKSSVDPQEFKKKVEKLRLINAEELVRKFFSKYPDTDEQEVQEYIELFKSSLEPLIKSKSEEYNIPYEEPSKTADKPPEKIDKAIASDRDIEGSRTSAILAKAKLFEKDFSALREASNKEFPVSYEFITKQEADKQGIKVKEITAGEAKSAVTSIAAMKDRALGNITENKLLEEAESNEEAEANTIQALEGLDEDAAPLLDQNLYLDLRQKIYDKTILYFNKSKNMDASYKYFEGTISQKIFALITRFNNNNLDGLERLEVKDLIGQEAQNIVRAVRDRLVQKLTTDEESDNQIELPGVEREKTTTDLVNSAARKVLSGNMRDVENALLVIAKRPTGVSAVGSYLKDNEKTINKIIAKMNKKNHFMVSLEQAKTLGLQPSESFIQKTTDTNPICFISLKDDNKLYRKPIWMANKNKKTLEGTIDIYNLIDASFADASKSAEVSRSGEEAATKKQDAAEILRSSPVEITDEYQTTKWVDARKLSDEQNKEAGKFFNFVKSSKPELSELTPETFFAAYYKGKLSPAKIHSFKMANGIEAATRMGRLKRAAAEKAAAGEVQKENRSLIIKFNKKIINETKKQNNAKDNIKERLMYLAGLLNE